MRPHNFRLDLGFTLGLERVFVVLFSEHERQATAKLDVARATTACTYSSRNATELLYCSIFCRARSARQTVSVIMYSSNNEREP